MRGPCCSCGIIHEMPYWAPPAGHAAAPAVWAVQNRSRTCISGRLPSGMPPRAAGGGPRARASPSGAPVGRLRGAAAAPATGGRRPGKGAYTMWRLQV